MFYCFSDKKVCTTSKKILQNYMPQLSQNFEPLRTTGDGNCLFRAISLAMYGVEERHIELRLRSVLEVVNNSHYYHENR